jgi:hypothetical protein
METVKYLEEDREGTLRQQYFRAGQQMWYSSSKGLFTCKRFVNVSLNGILEFAESVKLSGLDTFLKCN